MSKNETPTAANGPDRPTAGLLRRFAAGFYDGLLLLAMSLLAAAAVMALFGGFRQPVGTLHAPSSGQALANLVAISGCVLAYFGQGWRKAGQSLGMKAWKIRVIRQDGTSLHWRDVVRRLGCAIPFYLTLLVAVLAAMLHRPLVAVPMALPMLANVVWMLCRREGALHDRWSRTRVIRET